MQILVKISPISTFSLFFLF